MLDTDSTHAQEPTGANPPASPAADQPNSFNPAEFAKTLKAQLIAELKADKSLVQSVKDQSIAEIRKDKGMREYFAEFKKMQSEGMSDAEIEREMRIRELETRLQNNNPATEAQSPRQVVTPPANDVVTSILPSLGLQANDPEVTQVFLTGGDITEKISALAQISARRKSTPSPAAVVQPTGGTSSQQSTAQLEALYRQEMLAARGKGPQVGLAIKKKYQDAGLDVHRVNFSV